MTPKTPLKYNDEIVYKVGRLYVVLNQYFSQAYAGYSLNPAKFNLLMIIKHIGKERGISQIELGSHLFVSAANITKLIDSLEKKELVKRLPSKNDRRVNLVKITEKGCKLVEKVWVNHVEAINNLLQGFSDTDKNKFHGFLEKFLQECEQKAGEK